MNSTTEIKDDAYTFLCRWAKKHRDEPFSPETVIFWADVAGIIFQEKREWGPVFKRAAREGFIKRAGLFARDTSNGSVRPGWQGV